jgi:LysM repeat protein
MNNTSPLIPQGATPPRPKSSLYFKILMVLSVHVVVIGGMLLQGCKDTASTQAKQDQPAPGDTTPAVAASPNTTPATTPVPTEMPTTLNPNITNVVAGTAVSSGPTAPATQPMPSSATLVPKPSATDLSAPAAPGEAKEYVIAKGDLLGAIARKNGVSLKALKDANPGVNEKNLQIGHKLQIPASTAAVATTATPGATPAATAEAASTEGDLYVVKSGDTLTKIAKSHGTTFKKIMAMNDMKTTSIRAGQKLKLPTGKPAASEPAPAPAAAPAASASLTPAAPMKVSAVTPASTSSVAAN